MTKEPMTPAEAAEALYRLIPRRISVEMMSDYGIDVSEEQSRDMTREVLSFTLYWVSAAINAHIPRKYRVVLFQRVLELIQADWATEFKLETVKWGTTWSKWRSGERSMRRLEITNVALSQHPRKFQTCSKTRALFNRRIGRSCSCCFPTWCRWISIKPC